MTGGTLRISRPFGRTAGVALVLSLLLFGAFEGVLRTEWLRPYVAQLTPNLGSRHGQLEHQLARLESFVGREGGVDCIFLGSSLVWLGYNPDVFEEVIRQETGQEIDCFNLGIEALPASAAGVLAEVVAAEYHPWLLIYGTSARSYAPGLTGEETSVVLETPWIQYKRGNFSLKGWLYTHSYAFRYADQLPGLIKLYLRGQRETDAGQDDLNGFLPKTQPPNEVNLQAAAQVAAQYFHPYLIRPENLNGLRQVVAQQKDGVQVVIVEMPVSTAYYDDFENGKADYERFLTGVQSVLATEDVLFLQTSQLSLIPDEGWWDKSHMNRKGAEAFSAWLGQVIFQAVAAEKLRPPDMPLEEGWQGQLNLSCSEEEGRCDWFEPKAGAVQRGAIHTNALWN